MIWANQSIDIFKLIPVMQSIRPDRRSTGEDPLAYSGTLLPPPLSGQSSSISDARDDAEYAYYFEITLISGSCAVGFEVDGGKASVDVQADRSRPHSIALHSNGDLWIAGALHWRWTQPFQPGEVVGAGVRWRGNATPRDAQYFFTRNSDPVGEATLLDGADLLAADASADLIPFVGIPATAATTLRTNFWLKPGQPPFRHNGVRLLSGLLADPAEGAIDGGQEPRGRAPRRRRTVEAHPYLQRHGSLAVSAKDHCRREGPPESCEQGGPSKQPPPSSPTDTSAPDAPCRFPGPGAMLDPLTDSKPSAHKFPGHSPLSVSAKDNGRHTELQEPWQSREQGGQSKRPSLSIPSGISAPGNSFQSPGPSAMTDPLIDTVLTAKVFTRVVHAEVFDLGDIKDLARELRGATSASDAHHDALVPMADLCRSNLERLNETLQRATEKAESVHDLGELLIAHEMVTDAIDAAEQRIAEMGRSARAEGDVVSLLCHLRSQKQKRHDAAWGLLR